MPKRHLKQNLMFLFRASSNHPSFIFQVSGTIPTQHNQNGTVLKRYKLISQVSRNVLACPVEGFHWFIWWLLKPKSLWRYYHLIHNLSIITVPTSNSPINVSKFKKKLLTVMVDASLKWDKNGLLLQKQTRWYYHYLSWFC